MSVERNPVPMALKFADDNLANDELAVVKTLRNSSSVKLRNRSLSLGLPKSRVNHTGSHRRQRLLGSQGRAVRFIRLKRSLSSTSATTATTQPGIDPATQGTSRTVTDDAVGTSSMHKEECSSKSVVRSTSSELKDTDSATWTSKESSPKITSDVVETLFMPEEECSSESISLKRLKRLTSLPMKDTDQIPGVSSSTHTSTPRKMRAGIFERSWSNTSTEELVISSSTPEECSKSAQVAQDVVAITHTSTLPAVDPPHVSLSANETVVIPDVEALDNKTEASSPVSEVSFFVSHC